MRQLVNLFLLGLDNKKNENDDFGYSFLMFNIFMLVILFGSIYAWIMMRLHLFISKQLFHNNPKTKIIIKKKLKIIHILWMIFSTNIPFKIYKKKQKKV